MMRISDSLIFYKLHLKPPDVEIFKKFSKIHFSHDNNDFTLNFLRIDYSERI
jgi:hypothetical protein